MRQINKMLCYVQQSEVSLYFTYYTAFPLSLLRFSLTCGAGRQFYSRPSHIYYIFTQEGPSHPPSLCLRRGAVPHWVPQTKPALALRPVGWKHFIFLKMLQREIRPLQVGKVKHYISLAQHSCTESQHILKCKWIQNWYKKSTENKSRHFKSTLKISCWDVSISQSNLLLLKASGKERSILLTLSDRSNIGRPANLMLTGLPSSIISCNVKLPQRLKLVSIFQIKPRSSGNPAHFGITFQP